MHFSSNATDQSVLIKKPSGKFRSDKQEIPTGITTEDMKYLEKFSHRTAFIVGDNMDCVV